MLEIVLTEIIALENVLEVVGGLLELRVMDNSGVIQKYVELLLG